LRVVGRCRKVFVDAPPEGDVDAASIAEQVMKTELELVDDSLDSFVCELRVAIRKHFR
jgi:hypothetical protein